LTNAERKLKSENQWKERRCKLVNGMCKAYLCVDDQGSQPGETLQQTKTQTLIKTLRQRGLAVWGGGHCGLSTFKFIQHKKRVQIPQSRPANQKPISIPQDLQHSKAVLNEKAIKKNYNTKQSKTFFSIQLHR